MSSKNASDILLVLHSLGKNTASSLSRHSNRWKLSAKPPVQRPHHAIDAKYHNNNITPVLSEQSQADLIESPLPSGRISRIYEFGKLGIGLAAGTLARRRLNQENSMAKLLGDTTNASNIVSTLSRMRGAALKLGQMISINELDGVPVELQQLLTRLQASANYMPQKDLEKIMSSQLGSEWKSLFDGFDMVPVAAASIGQVHRARLKSDGSLVAVKVQYPGVAESVNSDLRNLSILLRFSGLLPKGLFLDNTIKVAQQELLRETDYVYEADSIEKFARLLQGFETQYRVPKVFRDISTDKVLVTQFMPGITLAQFIHNSSQQERDLVADRILRLCMKELFEFQIMQTDPNWSNFLYHSQPGNRPPIINLIDFGATREFKDDFISMYRKLLIAAVKNDTEAALEYSITLGFLTGDENEQMKQAHLSSLLALAKPFASTGYYDFGSQTVAQHVRGQIPVMVKYRLRPPPDESYSLHRKLSGAFLLCSKLNARVKCNEIFRQYLGDK